MVTVRYGGKEGPRIQLVQDDTLLAVRTHSRHLASDPRPEGSELSGRGRAMMAPLAPVMQLPEPGVEVLKYPGRRARSVRDEIRGTLAEEPDVRFAGRVLVDRVSRAPVLYTENFFIKFRRDVSVRKRRALLRAWELTEKRELDYAVNAVFAQAPEGTGQRIFDIAQQLLDEDIVELCHPELVRQSRTRRAFDPQWHLKKTRIGGGTIDQHANCESAWDLSQGEGITIAVIDDGVDVAHSEFSSTGKVVSPRDVTRRTNDATPGDGDNHGTACAGVACADGAHGASGVASAARLMPIRLASVLGSQAEADAFVWAAQNGADVISCSWGPIDGDWWDPADPRHQQVVPLPDATRLAIDWAIENGRGGKGCVVTWAAGNGNESVDNDGYASYSRVVAVAACNDRGRKSAYSDFGDAIWCAFPSNHGHASLTPGIWTTDRTGTPGYNPGQAGTGDAAGDYTNSFGGTSSSCPGVAGVAALVLGRNPALRWDEVKDVLKQACRRIDTANGSYDTDGHSSWYGYGRIDARRAVELAVAGPTTPATPAGERQYTAVHRAVQELPIPDRGSVRLAIQVADTDPITGIRIDVDITHTYRGDLVAVLHSPSAMGVAPITLQERTGGAADHLKQAWDSTNAPGLAQLIGKTPAGTWELEVRDEEAQDIGILHTWGVELTM